MPCACNKWHALETTDPDQYTQNRIHVAASSTIWICVCGNTMTAIQWYTEVHQHYCFNRGVFVHLLLSVEQNIHDAAETKKLTVLTWSLFGGEMFIFSPFLICIYIGKVDRNYLLINLRPNTNRNKSRLEHLLIKMKYYFSFTCKCKYVWPTLRVL